jgi:integrase
VIAAEKPDSNHTATLWEALYLTRTEMEELLAHVQQAGGQPWLYPMVAFAAYTGARRSELLRIALTDIDLKAGMATIREKKRTKGKLSSRKVPLTPKLGEILRAWMTVRPASSFLFCQPQRVVHSKKRRTEPTAVTKDEAHDHLRRALAGSKWKVLRGYHVLRHSFCSNLVAGGVDQRIIDEIVGHSTEEQRRRYRHLAPKATHDAVKSVYG